ncbi:methyltransferase domain-containing protein [Halorussus limi]|uniref:Methyltransferase domain-containing protein n=1 Tax=Halorussus limi TaxID=2938695 RepID=A0A8U0HQT2_9EURY|nr:methyltransferase domain-containing protein [Halorussus limi]UPV73211.1 methyltransferase domain-containing protein [Halorussus limi]
MTAEDLRETQVAWDEVAAGFDEYATPLTISFAEMALDRVDVGSGTRFLDVAAGSGALSIPAARLGAEVVATDISPAMVELLTARARDEELTDIEARVMDGHALEFEDDTFDVAASQNGVSLFPDMQRGVREMVRVTKPGGQVLILAFGPPTEAEFLTFFMGAMQAAIPGFDGLPMDPPPLPFQAADAEKLRAQLADARLNDIRIDTETWDMEIQSAEHLWDMVVNSNPIAATLVADLTEEQIAEVQRILDTKLRDRSGGSGPAVLTNRMHIAVGTK